MRNLVYVFLMLLPLIGHSDDFMWWNLKHGWQTGMPGWRSYIRITPGFLGPNALPVPEPTKGVVQSGSNLELGLDLHFREGDPTQNLFGKYYRSFAGDKIALEVYGVIAEHYAMSESVRDERFARDFDGKGIAAGDLYFATHVQLTKGRKFPDTMVRLACRTASGSHLDAARYSDAPGYFIDFSFSKQYQGKKEGMTYLPFASAGFYSWQTNDLLNLQNDALMYGLGMDIRGTAWSVSNSLSGYSGYKKEHDKPMVYTFDLKHKLKNHTVRLQYLYGIRDWRYQTIKLSFILKLKN